MFLDRLWGASNNSLSPSNCSSSNSNSSSSRRTTGPTTWCRPALPTPGPARAARLSWSGRPNSSKKPRWTWSSSSWCRRHRHRWCRLRLSRPRTTRASLTRPERGQQVSPNFFFRRTGLPVARTRWVQSTFSSHCQLSSNQCRWLTPATSIIFYLRKFLGILRIEPGAGLVRSKYATSVLCSPTTF